jgi:hypothetical protein
VARCLCLIGHSLRAALSSASSRRSPSRILSESL